jgi:hypothetical protein
MFKKVFCPRPGWGLGALLAAIAVASSWCVAAVGPGYGYGGYGYAAPVYGPSVVVAPPPLVFGGWGWHGYHGGGWHAGGGHPGWHRG